MDKLHRTERNLCQRAEDSHSGVICDNIHADQLTVEADIDKTEYLRLVHFRCNTSHEIFQIVEQEAAQRIGEAANDAPLEVVKMLHSHVLFPLEPVPPAAETAVQVSVKLKVHIQRIVLRRAPQGALSLYTHGGHRNAEFWLTLAVDDCYLEVSAEGIGKAHHFQLVLDGFQTVQQVLEPVSVTVHGCHLWHNAGGY